MVFGDLGKKLVLRPTSSQSVAPVKSKMPDGTSCKTKWGYVSKYQIVSRNHLQDPNIL